MTFFNLDATESHLHQLKTAQIDPLLAAPQINLK